MSEENQVAEQQVETVDYKAMYEKAKADLDIVAAKKDELYKETKAAKAAREQAIADAKKADTEKALKDGEFEKLFHAKDKEAQSLSQQLQDLKNSNRKEKIQISALRLAGELADGDNIELLSDFVTRDLDKIADESGVLSAEVLEAVKKEFAGNQKFKSLLRGSKASGGSATGNTRGAQDVQSLTRGEFAQLNLTKQRDFVAKVRTGSATLID